MFAADMVPFCPTQPTTVLCGASLPVLLALPVACVTQAVAAALACWMGRHSVLLRRVASRLPGWGELGAGVGMGMGMGLAAQVGVVVLLRQSPFLPFAVSNYYLGAATGVAPMAVLGGTLLGGFPQNVLWTAVGAGSQQMLDGRRGRDGLRALMDEADRLVSRRTRRVVAVLGVLATLALVAIFAEEIRSWAAAGGAGLAGQAASASGVPGAPGSWGLERF